MALWKMLEEEMFFHRKCGGHVALTNEGRTAERIITGGWSRWAMTCREIRCDECFSVTILEEDPWNGRGYFGVTTTSPDHMVDHENPLHITNGCWLMEVILKRCKMYEDGDEIISEYAELLFPTKNGFRLSVARRINGDLHFAVNGKDLGTAVKGVPENIYGYVWLGGFAKMIAID